MAEDGKGFVRGAAQIVMSDSCIPCKNGVCAECEYPRDFSELNATAVDAQDFISLREFCACYRRARDRHWDLFEERRCGPREAKASHDPAPGDENEPMAWCIDSAWEVVYRPYPDYLRERGFDEILSRISEAVGDAEIGVAGEFRKVVVLSTAASSHLGATPRVIGIESFQDQVARLLREMEMPGVLTAQRVTSVMQVPQTLADGDG